MKKLKWILIPIFACQFLTGQGQVDNQSEVNNKTQQVPSDTTGQAGGENTGASQNGNEQANTDAENSLDERISNTPAVLQTTTSESGSPAILAGEDGTKRDGTNNVQRASMNMAGSPAGSVDLAENNVNSDVEIKARQRTHGNNQQAIQQQSNKTSTTPGNAAGDESKDVNENNRKK